VGCPAETGHEWELQVRARLRSDGTSSQSMTASPKRDEPGQSRAPRAPPKAATPLTRFASFASPSTSLSWQPTHVAPTERGERTDRPDHVLEHHFLSRAMLPSRVLIVTARSLVAAKIPSRDSLWATIHRKCRREACAFTSREERWRRACRRSLVSSMVSWLFENWRHARCPECRSGIPGCETAAATPASSEQHEPASGVGFPIPTRPGARAGRPSEERQTRSRGRRRRSRKAEGSGEQPTRWHHLYLSEPLGFIPGEV